MRSLDEEEIARLHKQAHGVIDGGKPQPLPLAPEPSAPHALPRSKRGGSLSEVPRGEVDDATVPVPLLSHGAMGSENTPPPLPPSPAASAAEVWLEEAVTRPSAFADLASKVGTVPGAPASAEGKPVTADPVAAMREAHAQAIRSLRIMLILSAVTAFTVGLVLGALIFRG